MKKNKGIVDVDLDKDLQDAIERNNRKSFNSYVSEKEKLQQKEKRLSLIAITILAITIIMIIICMYKLNDSAMKSCMKNHEENYCEARV